RWPGQPFRSGYHRGLPRRLPQLLPHRPAPPGCRPGSDRKPPPRDSPIVKRTPPPPHDAVLRALRIAVTYGILAALWILLSDKLLALWLQSPEHLALASTIKGWGFVVVTAMLLFALLVRVPNNRSPSPQESEPPPPRRQPWAPIALL